MSVSDNQIFKPIDELTDLEASAHPVLDLCRVARGRSVIKGEGTRFESLVLPNFFGHHADIPSFAVLSFEAARRVLLDSEHFSSDFFGETLEKSVGRSLFCMDPPEHTRFRTLIQKGFMPRIVRSWDEQIIRPIIERSIAAVRDKGQADLAQELTIKFPYEIICRILGFPASDVDFVADRITRMTRATYDMDAAMKASVEMHAYVEEYLKERRLIAGDDFMSALLAAEVDGERLSDANIKAFIFHLFPAGMETTFRGASNLTHLLLSHRAELEKVRRDPALVGPSIEEMLRFEGPASMFPRKVKRATIIDGEDIPEGAMVYVMLAAANRDESRWQDPHRYDVSRPPQPHLGFGYGAHACVGLYLARTELAIFLEGVLREMPGLRWDPAVANIPPIQGWTLRSALTLPVVWDT